MLIARWQIDARFGHKQAVIDMLGAWARDIAPQIGWTADKGRMLTGSISAREATVVHEWAVGDLAEKSWAALGKLDAPQNLGHPDGALCGVGLVTLGRFRVA
jgi:hypothetical protein